MCTDKINDKNKMNSLLPSTVFVIAEKLPSTKTLKFSDFQFVFSNVL